MGWFCLNVNLTAFIRPVIYGIVEKFFFVFIVCHSLD